MITEFERYYCRACNKLFSDIARKPYYTRNNFCDNQIRLIYDMKYKHEMKQPNYHSQCPHCFSNKVVNVNDILTGKLILRSEKLAESTDKKMLKCLGEWLKFYGEITGYWINGNVLYNDNIRVKREIQRLLGTKTKPLNNIKNK